VTRTLSPARTAGVAVLGAALAVGLAVGCKPPPPSAQQAPPPPLVTVARPAVIPVQNYSDYNGHLEAVETVEIRARVKGFLEKVFFKEGDEVKAGDPLYVIDPREFLSAVSRSRSDIARAVADTASAEAQVLLAQSEMDRLESLGKSATKSELARATAVLAANKAAVDVAAANKRSAEAALRNAELQVGYTDIKSPIAGRISRTLVTPGNLVGGTAADTLLTTIVSTDPIYVYFDAPERDRDSLDPLRGGGTKADARPVLVGVANEGGYPHTGVIDFIENRIDIGTGTVRVRGRLPNPAGGDGKRVLFPGLFARVRAPLGPPTDRPVIPEEALMTGQEGRFVYVIGPENKVLKRTVRVGTTVWRAPPPEDKSPRWQLVTDKPGKDGKPPPPGVVRAVVAVESGLTADDVVIVNGLQKVRPGAPATPDERQFSPPATAK
jgi:multidrug efflux system membrane fusion protein